MSFFTYEEVLSLDKVQEKHLDKVLYHYWVNTAHEEELRVLDALQLFFEDGETLGISGRTEACLKLVTVDLEKDKEALLNDFGGKIMLQTEEVTGTELWAGTGILNHISLRKSEEGHYLNDALLLSFQHKEIVVFYDGDSVSAEEVHEEIDDEQTYE